jgi:F420H(2)-dependent quinone reductase
VVSVKKRLEIAGGAGVHRFLYRISGGRLGSSMGKAKVLLLTTTGRRTGKPHTTPLIYVKDGADFAIVASNGGSDEDAAWWLNLKVSPTAEFQARRQRFRTVAMEASAEEHERLWPSLIEVYPRFSGHPAKTRRPIPVVLLKNVTLLEP